MSIATLALVNQKRLGDHLLEAGLITPGQIEVALYDQQVTGMRFGDILVARGWIKEEILEDLANRLTAKSAKSVRSLKHKATWQSYAA